MEMFTLTVYLKILFLSSYISLQAIHKQLFILILILEFNICYPALCCFCTV